MDNESKVLIHKRATNQTKLKDLKTYLNSNETHKYYTLIHSLLLNYTYGFRQVNS